MYGEIEAPAFVAGGFSGSGGQRTQASSAADDCAVVCLPSALRHTRAPWAVNFDLSRSTGPGTPPGSGQKSSGLRPRS